MNVTFFTGNKGKLEEARNILEDIIIRNAYFPISEIQAVDSREVVVPKLKIAYDYVGGPVFVDDTSLHLGCLNGLPGAMVKLFMGVLKAEGCWDMVKRYDDRKAEVKCTIGYTNDRKNIQIFEGTVYGIITPPSGPHRTGLIFDRIFTPIGYCKNFAEMTEEVKNKISHRGKALIKFKKYLESDING